MERNGERWIPVKPICEAIGLEPARQTSRVQKDGRFMNAQLGVHDALGREQATTFINLRSLEGFLYTINVRNSTKPEVRERLTLFQKGLTELIHNSFNGLTTGNETIQMLMQVIEQLKAQISELQQQRSEDRQLINYLVGQQDIQVSNAAREMVGRRHNKNKLTLVM